MAVQPTDLLDPRGELPPDLLPVPPEESATYASPRAYLLALIGPADAEGEEAGWLARAAGLTEDEDAQRAYVYARAFHKRYLRALQDPTRVDREGQGSTQYAVAQVTDWKALADLWDAEFARLSGTTVGSVVVAPAGTSVGDTAPSYA